MIRTKSEQAHAEALRYIAGGVNSPVRALRNVGETPLFIKKARGASLTDVDGNRLSDYCLSWGVFLLGHSNQAVNRMARQALSNGSSYGISSPLETELARRVVIAVPNVERVRFVSSGTEAVMSAVRLARGFTGRDLIVKFDGCYHGHADHLLVSAGSGVARLAGASSAGVPESFAAHTVSLPFNDREAVGAFFRERGGEVAAVLIEPVPANMGVVLPEAGFLEQLRELTEQHGALLIFDEVITGFRLSLGGAQERFGITPDLTTWGKILGGGFPAAAFGGRADIMAQLAPEGDVYQAGTLSGNPVAMSAGLATLNQLAQPDFYARLEKRFEPFFVTLERSLRTKGIRLNRIGTMFTLFCTEVEPRSFADVQQADTERFARLFRHLLECGIYISPAQMEACFLSVVHTDKQLREFIRAIDSFPN